MRIVVIFDGSDDGLEGLRTVTKRLQLGGEPSTFTLAIVAWPPRPSPIWDRAFEQQIVADDLHRAMAEVGAVELGRLRTVFAGLGPTKPAYLEGDPVDAILSLLDSSHAELLLAGLTRGKHARTVNEGAFAILQRSSVPVILAFGPGGSAHGD